ncbi:Cap [Circoviridae sp.]|nr:Cap [Circoviridae sp.]
MAKGVIDFHYDSGKQYVKKRKRVPGANPDKKPEIKQFNPRDGTGGFDGINFFPLVKVNQATTDNWLPYRLYPLSWPLLGTGANERIGNSFFLKAIRLKGYIEINRCVFRPIRWRLKLFRLEKPMPLWYMTGNYTQQTGSYLELYKNCERFAQGISVQSTIDRCRHNYYKMIKNLPKVRPYTSKVIASGVIPINNKFISQGTKEYGQVNAFQVTSSVEVYDDDCGCYPIDVLIKCNDRITYSLQDDAYQPDIRYCLVLEDDFGVGVNVKPAVFIPGDDPITNTPIIEFYDTSYPCYWIRLFARGYFTDD